MVSTPLSGRLTNRVGPRWLITGAAAILLVTFALLPVASTTVVGAGIGMAAYGFGAWAVNVPQQHRLIALRPSSPALVVALNASALYLGVSLSGLVGAGACRSQASPRCPGWPPRSSPSDSGLRTPASPAPVPPRAGSADGAGSTNVSRPPDPTRQVARQQPDDLPRRRPAGPVGADGARRRAVPHQVPARLRDDRVPFIAIPPPGSRSRRGARWPRSGRKPVAHTITSAGTNRPSGDLRARRPGRTRVPATPRRRAGSARTSAAASRDALAQGLP